MALPIDFANGQVQLTVPAQFMSNAQGPIVVDPLFSTFGINAGYTHDLEYSDVAYITTSNLFAFSYQSSSLYRQRRAGRLLRFSTGTYVDRVYVDFTFELHPTLPSPPARRPPNSTFHLSSRKRLRLHGSHRTHLRR
ncbi:MAG: hypothetical protein R3F17_09835 [Planctomycetota bacterium]